MNDKDTVVDAYAARRDAVIRGLASFCECTPDFDMSARLRRSAAEHILGMVDLAAAPSTSVREEGLEAALRECAKPYFWDADGFWPDASTPAHKQAEMERRQRLALAALVPSTDEEAGHAR